MDIEGMTVAEMPGEAHEKEESRGGVHPWAWGESRSTHGFSNTSWPETLSVHPSDF